jgi:hypothetical protein
MTIKSFDYFLAIQPRITCVGGAVLACVLAACGDDTPGDDTSPMCCDGSPSDGRPAPDGTTPDGPPPTCEERCVPDDGCCPVGCTAAEDDDCESPGPSRLVVLDHDGTIHVWNDTSTLVDRAADVRIEAGASSRLSLAHHGNRLVVASEDPEFPLALYEDYWTVAGAAAPADRIPASKMAGTGSEHNRGTQMRVGPGAHLWVGTGAGVWLLEDGASLGSGVGQAAYFTHDWHQILSFAYDADGERLLGGQISGAGIVVWDDPFARAAGEHSPDWTLDSGTAAWSMRIAAGRLFAAAHGIAIWNEVTSLAGPSVSNLTLGEGSGIPDAFIPHMTVERDVLLVAVDDGGPLSSVRGVNLYRDAADLDGEREPDQFLVEANMRGPRKTYLDAAGTLYILDADGPAVGEGQGSLYVYDHALEAPVLRARITTGLTWPTDFVVVE